MARQEEPTPKLTSSAIVSITFVSPSGLLSMALLLPSETQVEGLSAISGPFVHQPMIIFTQRPFQNEEDLLRGKSKQSLLGWLVTWTECNLLLK